MKSWGGGVNERHNDGDDSVRAEEEWGRMNQSLCYREKMYWKRAER